MDSAEFTSAVSLVRAQGCQAQVRILLHRGVHRKGEKGEKSIRRASEPVSGATLFRGNYLGTGEMRKVPWQPRDELEGPTIAQK